MIEAAQHPWGDINTAMVWAGLAVMVSGSALLRVAGELVLVVFRIHERVGAVTPGAE